MSQLPDTSVLGYFRQHLGDFRRLAYWMIALGSCPPILDLLFNIGPPWPHRTGVAAFTTIWLWAALLFTYSQWQIVGLERLRKRTAWLFISTILFFAIYIFLGSFFIVDAPTSRHQIARGFFLKPEWQDVLKEGRFPDGEAFPVASEHDLLAAVQWKADVIYPMWTVAITQSLLLIAWLFSFGSLAALSSTFILTEQKKKSNRARREQSNSPRP